MFRLERNEEIEPGIKRILIEQIDDSLSRLSDPAGSLDIAVHETRKNFKKMRAVLRLVRDALGEDLFQAENACYRDASRQLAPIRDGAVLVETVGLIKQEYKVGLSQKAFDNTSHKLNDRQEIIKQRLLEDSKTVTEVQEILINARARVQDFELKEHGAPAILPGLRRVYRQCRKKMAFAYTIKDDAHLFHDWRKRVKYLWHQIEVLQLVWPDYMASLARELHELSKYLGDSHDLVVLGEVLRQENELFGNEPEIHLLITLMAQRQKDLEQLARPIGKRLFVEPAGSFAKRIGTYWQVGMDYNFFGISDNADSRNEMPPSAPVFASTKEVAEQMGTSVQNVRSLIHKGELDAFKVGKTWAVRLN